MPSSKSLKTVKAQRSRSFNMACFDIETTNLTADYGVVLCGVVANSLTHKTQLHSQRLLNKRWDTRADDDREVVKAIFEDLDRADFWVAHNGANFDIPFLFTRAAYWGLPTPKKRAILDPVIVSRRHFRLSGNSLHALSKAFNLPRKTELDPNTWRRASLARDPSAMIAIEKHCQRDVEVLMALAPMFRGLWRHLGSTGNFY